MVVLTSGRLRKVVVKIVKKVLMYLYFLKIYIEQFFKIFICSFIFKNKLKQE